MNDFAIATCIGCGCDDLRACLPEEERPCSWLRLDRQAGLGVCSECPDMLDMWDNLEPRARSSSRIATARKLLFCPNGHGVAASHGDVEVCTTCGDRMTAGAESLYYRHLDRAVCIRRGRHRRIEGGG